MKKFLAMLCCAAMIIVSGCGNISAEDVNNIIDGVQFIVNDHTIENETENTQPLTADATATVHFLDVGQGDSEFIELPDGKTVLIDASTRSAGANVVSYVEDLGYDAIDIVIATHPHEDHIGGLPDVIDAFDIGQIYMSNGVTTTKIFETLMDKVSKNMIPVDVIEAGELLMSGVGYELTCVGPMGDEYDNLNDYSIVTRLDIGSSSFLFTGDCESNCEQEMINAGMDLDVDILKVGHHGSSTSTSEKFLEAVTPAIAVISCGANNDYGHPHEEILQKLEAIGCNTLRTDENGTITIATDGVNGYVIDCEEQEDAAA